MTLTTESSIYIGPWINWSRGLILGSTITLSQRHAGLLTAFLGIFVTAAGASCWRILSFAIHQFRAGEASPSQDGLLHQQQVVFRNHSTSGGAAWQLSQLMWYWRKLPVRAILRTLPLIALALCNMALFAVAGVFSSEVTKAAGNETLVRSSNCGFIMSDTSLPSTSHALIAAINAKDVNDTLVASTYSRACYDDNEKSPQCNQFAQPRIPWKAKVNASCPFASELCLEGPMSAYEMDTGLVDSHEMLGINAPRRNRMQYRKVTSCSPIQAESYVWKFNDTNPDHIAYGATFLRYAFGEVGSPSNYTFQYNTRDLGGLTGYVLTTFAAFASRVTDSGWKPAAALNRSDADVSIMFLAANNVKYEAPVLDPFFSATAPTPPMQLSDGSNHTYYESDYLVNVLACTDQYQICNAANKKCTSLTGHSLLQEEVTNLNLNDVQRSTALRLDYATTFQSTYSSVRSRGAGGLRASETLSTSDLVHAGLPTNQWITEVSSWFAISLAKLQQMTVDYATNPAFLREGLALARPQTETEERLCKQQKIRSPHGYVSFSVLGVGIILVVGSLIIFANLVLDIIVGYVRQKLEWKDHKRLQWVVDEMLQLQRLAYEEAGQGHWSGGTNAVPVTRKGDEFGFPAGLDEAHPRFGRDGNPSGGYGETRLESCSLIDGKQMSYRVDSVPEEHRYR